MKHKFSVGDAVAVVGGSPSARPVKDKVARVTPSGQVVLRRRSGRFSPDGYVRGEPVGMYGATWIRPWTEQDEVDAAFGRELYKLISGMDEIKRKYREKLTGTVTLRDVSQVRQVAALLRSLVLDPPASGPSDATPDR
jgi:hypothetical protein